MPHTPCLLAVLLLLPVSVQAATAPTFFSAGRSVLVASSSPGNAYAAGASVVITAPVSGDFSAFGGSIITAASVSGDALMLAGSVYSRARVGGDFRTAGANITIDEPVAGDLIALGFSVQDAGRAGGDVLVIAANVALTAGAGGPVTIYGNTISLAGTFASDVTIVSSGRVTLAPDTTIVGALSYRAPEEASIPAAATIRGGITYTNASYLPDAGTSRVLATISIGFFLLVRILGALILAGLIAGLFPRLAEAIVDRATSMRPSRVLLTMLLGFAFFIVTPVLFLLLMLTFVGIGLALLAIIVYALIMLLSLIYAGILLGSFLARRYAHRTTVLWHDGVLGMLALSVVTLVPYIGVTVVFLLTMFSAGALILTSFNFAFLQEEQTSELV